MIVNADWVDQKRVHLEALVELLDGALELAHRDDDVLYHVFVHELPTDAFGHGALEKGDLRGTEPAKAPAPPSLAGKRHELFDLPEDRARVAVVVLPEGDPVFELAALECCRHVPEEELLVPSIDVVDLAPIRGHVVVPCTLNDAGLFGIDGRFEKLRRILCHRKRVSLLAELLHAVTGDVLHPDVRLDPLDLELERHQKAKRAV